MNPEPRKAASGLREALETVAAGLAVPCLRKEADGWHARWRPAAGPDDPLVDKAVREATVSPLSRNAERQRHETLHDAWLVALRSETGLVVWDDAECEAFARTLDEWAAPLARRGRGGGPRFHAAIGECGGRRSGGDFKFELQCDAPSSAAGWRSLGLAFKLFPPLRRIAQNGKNEKTGADRLSVELTADESAAFAKNGAALLAAAGCEVDLPKQDANLAVESELEEREESVYEASLHVTVAGMRIGAAELRFLLDQGSSIVYFRGRLIEVDRDILREALRYLEKYNGRKLKESEAFAFAAGICAPPGLDASPAKTRGRLAALVAKARETGISSAAKLEGGAAAMLRPYQRRGAAWMLFLAKAGFGPLLADDMGLGKTAQTIAFLQNAAAAPALVVAPLGLLANWRREFEKFAPGTKVLVHAGDKRLPGAAFAKAAKEADAVLVNYALLAKEIETLRRVGWGAVVLDEAQTVKNPDTKTAQAACALAAGRTGARPFRVALTGTPVENSPADVWSIENFLNPGFLGPRKDFQERCVKPLAADPASKVAGRLAKALEPIVLRRLKTEPEVAAELGEKRTVKEFCELSAGQRMEYEDALAAYRSGRRRRGDMFALIVRLKQICGGESKRELLCDILSSIFDAGESALVFTQFVQTGKALQELLERKFGRPFPFLHGAVPAKEREKLVDGFMSCKTPSAFILSLKAGGYGLNLVKATHVVHFDRWWNPAVEAQATDRAYRIGQRRDVLSHLLVTEGTLEERIDALIEKKTALAGNIIGTGESFLAGLAPGDFDALVACRPAPSAR